MTLGATGKYPEGKLNEDDEGGLRFAIYANEGNVIIDYNTAVHWVGLPKDQALALAEMIIETANTL